MTTQCKATALIHGAAKVLGISGEITAASEPGRGTTFKVALPC